MPTPLAIVLAMCQGPLRLFPCRVACRRGTFIASRFRIHLQTVSTAKRSMDLLVTCPTIRRLPPPGSFALAQLPSPRACSLEAVIWYNDLPEASTSLRGLVQCGRQLNNSMPMTGVPKPCTEARDPPSSNSDLARTCRIMTADRPFQIFPI